MKRLVLLGLFATFPAFAGDDPAIRVCDEIIKQSIKTPKSYERARAAIDGTNVHITYDAVNLFNAPVRSTFTCAFVRQEDGFFTLTSPMMRDLEAEMATILAEVQKASEAGFIEDDERALIYSRLESMQQRIGAAAVEGVQHVLWAQTVDGFPIDPSETSLSDD